MAYDGTLKFDTSMETSGFQKGANSLDSVVKGLAVFKILEAGFRTIVNSIDMAVTRYDTLNKFPQVLQNMGYGMDEAEAATKKLSDGVQGLPTRLDEIVATAQRLTVLTGNLDMSVDATLALNNAFLASGSDSAAASRGLDQYTRMLSTGKVTMISWRTLQETMSYALQKTAEAFGFAGQSAQNDLYAALNAGDITFDQFNAKIIELNKGIGGFAEMAKTATGGIATAFTNLRARTAAGVTEIIAALDRGFAQSRFKSIENIISSSGTILKNILTSVAKVFELAASKAEVLVPAVIAVSTAFAAYKVIGSVTTTFRGFIDIVKTAQTALAASQSLIMMDVSSHTMLTAALTRTTTAEAVRTAAKKVGMTIDKAGNLMTEAGIVATTKETAAVLASAGALTAKTVIVGLLTGSIGLVTAAQWVWNAAVAANPIGFAVIGIITLIAAVTALISIFDKSVKEYREQRKEIEALTKAQKQTAEDIKASADAFKENSESIKANAQVSREYVGLLREISAETADSKDKNLRMAAAVDSLSASIDELNIAYDEEKGEIVDLNSRQKIYLVQIESLINAKEKLAAANAWEERASELIEEEIRLRQEQILVEGKIAEIEANNILSGQQKRKLILDLQNTYEEYGKQIKSIQTDIATANAQVAKSDKENAEAFVANWEKKAKAQQDAYEAMNGARDAEGRSIAALTKLYDTTTDVILAEMAEQGQSLEEWSETKAGLFTKEGQSIQGLAEQYGMSVDEITKYMDEWGMTLDEVSEHLADSVTKEGLSLEQLAAKWGTTTDAIMTEMDSMGLSMQDWSDKQQKAWDDYAQAVADKTNNVVNGFKEIPAKFDQSAAEMLEILKTNKERYAEWEETMEVITRRLGPTMAEEFRSLGPSATSAMQEILNSAELLEEFQQVAGVKTNAITDRVKEEWNDPDFIGAPGKAIDASAQMVTQNNAMQDAVKRQVAETKTVAQTVDFSSVGQGISANIAGAITSETGRVTSAVTGMSTSVQNVFKAMSTQAKATAAEMMTSVNSTLVSKTNTVKASITSLGNTITTALNSAKTQAVNITIQMMTEINSAIVSRTSTVKASTTALTNAVITTLNELPPKGDSIAAQMMGKINSAIITQTSTVKSSATALSSGVVSNLQSMIAGGTSAANNMMDGILTAMKNKEASLYKKAGEIASKIAETMKKALDVNSPSRVMIWIFENVMMGIYKGMDGMSGLLFSKADDIADGLAARLTISPDILREMLGKMQAATGVNPFSGTALTPLPALAGTPGGTSYVTSLVQNITTPKPLSASEMTREGQDMLRRSRWQLP